MQKQEKRGQKIDKFLHLYKIFDKTIIIVYNERVLVIKRCFMYIVDMHCDTLSRVSASQGMKNEYNLSKNYPHLQFFAHFSHTKLGTAAERRRKALEAANIYLSECERLSITRVSSTQDVFSVSDGGITAGMFTIEGGAGLFADSPELDVLYRAGLRIMGIAWDRNELSSSAMEIIDTGLTLEGRKMIWRMAEMGITLDVSHLSDQAFYEAFELSPLPHIATHSNFRAVCDHDRNLTDNMAKMIAARGGVIGLNLCPRFLSEDGYADTDDILRQVDHGLSLVGDRALAFGFDIDGTDGKYPSGIDTTRSIHDQVIELLISKYPVSTVERIAGENVIEFLKGNLIS